MFLIKTMLKIFVVLPAIAYGTFKAASFMTVSATGHINWWVSIGAAILASLAYLIWDGKQEKSSFDKHARSQGINPEYVACYGDNGIAIDNTNKKVFAGRINKGKVFDYNDISSIEWENSSVGNHMKYLIHINTTDFDFPKLTIGFAGNRGVREEAYAKLRAALKIS
ncbi:hypothetical protein DSLASN_07810 [Desulfoluna limicola]|uniref:YcxB-like protein domain-containing protein n=1 Tax=Desulfoluna limicola TaxID=2810562 RepID=A0ABM7PC55_9BACT|nr:hypothetical protein [Desulfoluna limicola]BCS95149.1 hypothetical protein DSLASN_07810 [Desulfoluna limicola]